MTHTIVTPPGHWGPYYRTYVQKMRMAKAAMERNELHRAHIYMLTARTWQVLSLNHRKKENRT